MESAFLPLVVWTPVVIIIFAVARLHFGNGFSSNLNVGNILNELLNSFSAYFQIPRSDRALDIIERVISAPILGSGFIAIRRKFERRK
jgi:hypothetical protein